MTSTRVHTFFAAMLGLALFSSGTAWANQIDINAFNSNDTLVTFENGTDFQDVTGDDTVDFDNNRIINPVDEQNSFNTAPLNNYFDNIPSSTQPSPYSAFVNSPSNMNENIDINFDSSLGVRRVGLYLASDGDDADFTYSAFGGSPVSLLPNGSFTENVTTATKGVFVGISADSTIIRFNIAVDNDESLVFDDLRFGVVPEPASLMLAGLGSLMLLSRRR